MRSASARTLAMPSVEPSACTWRLMFDSATWSRSISISPATPQRASASTAHDPTPPRPTTATRACAQPRVPRVAVQPAQAAEAALEIGVARDRVQLTPSRSMRQIW